MRAPVGKKNRRKPPPSQVCTQCSANASIVTGTRPRICVECFCGWGPDPKAKAEAKKGKRK